MSRKDFERIAKGIKAFYQSEGSSLTFDQFDSLIDQMALACQDQMTNPHTFNYDKFRNTCL